MIWILITDMDVTNLEFMTSWHRIILTCSGSNASSSHKRDGPYGGTHAWGPPFMWEEGQLIPEHLSFFPWHLLNSVKLKLHQTKPNLGT